MLSYEVNQKIIEEAVIRAEAVGDLGLSYRGRSGRVIGAIGEIIFEQYCLDYFLPFVNQTNATTHDYILETQRGRITLDVKTRDRTVAPQPHYLCGTSIYNHDHQKPDYFFFISTEREKQNEMPHLAHLVGVCNYRFLHERGTVTKQGEPMTNGVPCKFDMINVAMDQLKGPEDAARIWYNRLVRKNKW